MNFDAHYLTNLGAKCVGGENSQILEADTGNVVLMNRNPVFYNGFKVDIDNVVY